MTAVEQHTLYTLQNVTVVGADGKTDIIQATPNHPFYVMGTGWTDAGDLTAGEELEEPDGSYADVVSSEADPDSAGVTVYNLTVNGDHTYFVDQGGAVVWVHNVFCPNPFGKVGDLVTQGTRIKVEAQLGAAGFTKIETEVEFLQGAGGLKTRFADVVGTNAAGERAIVQIGKLTPSGSLITRELNAIFDIALSPAFNELLSHGVGRAESSVGFGRVWTVLRI